MTEYELDKIKKSFVRSNAKWGYSVNVSKK